MHGYFVSLKLYETARLIVNPFAYAEHREKMVREKMDKMAETRIRTKKDVGVKVNKALAEKILKDEERALKKKRKTAERKGENAMDVDDPTSQQQKPTLLSDPRFSQVFEDAAFAIDETSREFALLNPSSVRNLELVRVKQRLKMRKRRAIKFHPMALAIVKTTATTEARVEVIAVTPAVIFSPCIHISCTQPFHLRAYQIRPTSASWTTKCSCKGSV